MKNFILYAILVAAVGFIQGCGKVLTNYYNDEEKPGQAIFSNTGNELLTGYTNGHPWRSIDRKTGYGSSEEIKLTRTTTKSTMDTITIQWFSDYGNQDRYDIAISFPVAKNFKITDIASFEGRRLNIDSANGVFSLTQSAGFRPLAYGKGSIYFNTARIDSIGAINLNGRIAGLLEASFNIPAIPAYLPLVFSSGRFDDDLDAANIEFR